MPPLRKEEKILDGKQKFFHIHKKEFSDYNGDFKIHYKL